MKIKSQKQPTSSELLTKYSTIGVELTKLKNIVKFKKRSFAKYQFQRLIHDVVQCETRFKEKKRSFIKTQVQKLLQIHGQQKNKEKEELRTRVRIMKDQRQKSILAKKLNQNYLEAQNILKKRNSLDSHIILQKQNIRMQKKNLNHQFEISVEPVSHKQFNSDNSTKIKRKQYFVKVQDGNKLSNNFSSTEPFEKSTDYSPQTPYLNKNAYLECKIFDTNSLKLIPPYEDQKNDRHKDQKNDKNKESANQREFIESLQISKIRQKSSQLPSLMHQIGRIRRNYFGIRAKTSLEIMQESYEGKKAKRILQEEILQKKMHKQWVKTEQSLKDDFFWQERLKLQNKQIPKQHFSELGTRINPQKIVKRDKKDEEIRIRGQKS